MTISAVRTASISYSGGDTTAGTGISTSSTNADAPMAGAQLVNLSSGFNTVTLPTGHTIYGVDITPPSGNTTTLTLKGITGDTGVPLHLTKTTSVAFAAGTTTFGLTTGGAMAVSLSYW